MRTVISHFYNEEYMLPWWLKHHVNLFDYGVLIDNGSTDNSADICRQLAPHWLLVRSKHHYFDCYLNDLEVMNYEMQYVGWKIALTVTEFLMSDVPLSLIESAIKDRGLVACVASSMFMVDANPEIMPSHDLPLPLQKYHGIDDNALTSPESRAALGLSPIPSRNRLYHCNSTGMYFPGRHQSHLPNSTNRSENLVIFGYRYSPWNELTIRRKAQIGPTMSPEDRARGWGMHHHYDENILQNNYLGLRRATTDLHSNEVVKRALDKLAESAY